MYRRRAIAIDATVSCDECTDFVRLRLATVERGVRLSNVLWVIWARCSCAQSWRVVGSDPIGFCDDISSKWPPIRLWSRMGPVGILCIYASAWLCSIGDMICEFWINLNRRLPWCENSGKCNNLKNTRVFLFVLHHHLSARYQCIT